MAKALRFISKVAGAVAIVASVIPGLQPIAAIAGAVSAVAGIGARLLTKPPPARGSVTETIVAVDPPSPYGMGEGYFGGVLRHKVGYGPTLKKVPNPFLFEAMALCVAGPIAGPITPQVDFGPVTSYYSGWLATDTRLGARPDTALTAPLQANPTGWSTNHKMSGTAAIAWNHKFDKEGKIYASGLPTRGVLAKWALCYDPRKDSTRPGGSGSHRLGVESTYEWSELPALHAGTYAFGRYVNGKRVIGVGLPDEGIDWEGIAAWANDCQANGWRMFGFVFEGAEDDAQRRWQNLRDICIAGGGEPLFSGAVLGFHWQRPRVPLDTVTEADLADGPQEVTAMQSWRDRLNTVRPRYTSAAHNWELVPADELQVASYLAEDGEERAEDVPFNFVKDVNQAAQLAGYWVANSRELTPITLTLMPRLRDYRPGECLHLALPELGLDHDAVILRREFDPASMTVTLTLVTEDPAKHAFALGRTGVAPPTPSLTNSAEDRDTITREARAPYWPEVDGPGRPADDATRNVARGTYEAGATYVRGDEVLFSGSSYRLIVETSTGNAPPDVARWALLANAGSGPAGADGLPGLTIIVSNEAHVVATAADGSGGDYSSAGGTMRLLRGDTVLTPSFSVPAKTPNTSWININSSTGAYTVTDPGVDLATATLRATWAGIDYEVTYTLAKSKQGVTGPRLALAVDAQGFTFTDGQPNPASQTITIEALLNNLSGTPTWSTSPSVTLGGSGNTRTLSVAAFGTNRQVTVTATLGGITDKITIVRLDRTRLAASGSALNTGHETDSVALWFNSGNGTNPLTLNGSGATYSVQAPGDVPVGVSCIRAVETTPQLRNILSAPIPLDTTKTYKLSTWVRTTGNRVLRLTCAFQDAAGANIIGSSIPGWFAGTFAYWGYGGAGHPEDEWRYYEIFMGPRGSASTPANGKTFCVGFTYGDGGTSPMDLEFAGYRVEEVIATPDLSGTLAARPASGAFVGQTYLVTSGPSVGFLSRWDGSVWAAGPTRNTGALNEDGLDAIDAGGPLFIGQLPGGRVDGDFGGNFIADPIFGEGWVYSNAAYSPGLSGANLYDRHRAVFLGEGVIWFLGSSFPSLERGAVQAGETYYFSGWFFRSSSATGNITARVETYDATGAYIGVEDIPGVTTIGGPNNVWYRMQGQWTCPAGVAYVRPLVGNNTGGNSSTIFAALPYFGRHQPGADVTATAQRTIEPQFPVIEIKQGEAGHTGNRTVTHVAKRGTATLTGGTWSLPSSNLGAGSASINSSTGTVTLSVIVQSGSYTVRYTHTDGFVTEITVNVTYVPNVAAGVGSIASSITKPFSSTSFVAISNDMTIALPSGVTVANLLCGPVALEVPNALPAGSTNVEVKWQRETSPGTWADVGAAASASPHPGVIDEGGFPSLLLGSVTCNRTATGLVAGSTQKFRLVARVSGGTTRTVTPFGTVSAGG